MLAVAVVVAVRELWWLTAPEALAVVVAVDEVNQL
jgi:hypothetical protein